MPTIHAANNVGEKRIVLTETVNRTYNNSVRPIRNQKRAIVCLLLARNSPIPQLWT